jgi:hypothetical protein
MNFTALIIIPIVIIVIGLIVEYWIIKPLQERQSKALNRDEIRETTKPDIPQTPIQNGIVRLTRTRDLQSPNWYGLVKPKAILDIWIRYDGPGELFIQSIKLYHIESGLLSGASGAFPPSHRYKMEYSPNSVTEYPLNPPLIINPCDQNEIHFEIEIFPRKDVSGYSECVLFILFRNSQDQKGSLPVLSPKPRDVLISRVLSTPIILDMSTYSENNYRRAPVELRSMNTKFLLEPGGSIAFSFGQGELTSDPPTMDLLKSHIDELKKIGLDPSENDRIAGEAITLFGLLGDKNIIPALEEIRDTSISEERRYAAKKALLEKADRE